MIDLSLADSNISCLDGDPIDESRSIVDPKIDLEESIRALKSCRNELSPISRLPVEILCKIFKFCESRVRMPEFWTNYSQVSQQWRSSALSAPELWTNIPLEYPRWAQEMLIRSKKANLTIRSYPSLDVKDPKIIETVRLCLSEMNRVEKIDFAAIPGQILEEIFRDCSKSAPQLHTLRISSSSSGNAFPIHDDFLYDTELLRHVQLIRCKISWDSRLLTDLTRLNLQDSLKANSSESIIQVLHALQRMPALTDLYLGDSIPDDSEGLSPYVVVDLPCLRVLDISSGLSALTPILRHITFPSTATLVLECEERSTQIDFSNFLSVLATKFLSTLVIRSLSLDVPYINSTLCDYLGFDLSTRTTALLQDCHPTSQISQSQLQLELSWPRSQVNIRDEVLTCAFDAMNLSFLTQLQISTRHHDDNINSQTWVKTFGKLPLLERVCMQSTSPRPFLEALVHKTKAAEKSEAAYRDVSFPKLRYIHLEYAKFFSRQRAELIDTLLDCLMERYERNAEVQVLRLDKCYDISSNNKVERLKEVVVDVIWDGRDLKLEGW